MAKYRPPKVDSGFTYGERGAAETRLSENKKEILIRFRDSGKKFRVRRTKELAKLFPGKWYIQLTADEDEIQNFRPLSGNFKGVTEKFASKEGEEPKPKTAPVKYTLKDGKEVSYEKVSFWVLIKILEPEKYAGIVVSKEFRYNFREAIVDGKSVVGFMSKGDRTKELEEYCDLTGVWNRGPMPWKDNILPDVQKRILRENQPFMFLMKDGWIDTLYEATPDEESDNDADWEEDTTTETKEEKSAPVDDVKELDDDFTPDEETDDDAEDDLDWEDE